VAVTAIVAIALAATPAHAEFTFNGSAKPLVGGFVRLTDGGFLEAGSVFFNDPETITTFETTFTFRLFGGTTPNKADGFTFCIQGNGPTALGRLGGALGYGPDFVGGPPHIPNSVAIKFDLFDAAGEGNSTGLFRNGTTPKVPPISNGDVLVGLKGTGIDLHSEDVYMVDMTYTGPGGTPQNLLSVTIINTTTGASATQYYQVDIPDVVGGSTAFVGFTGGTGGLTAVQDILTWTFGVIVPFP
jgi:hypothetical protein